MVALLPFVNAQALVNAIIYAACAELWFRRYAYTLSPSCVTMAHPHRYTPSDGLEHEPSIYNGAFPLHGTVRYGSLLGGFPLGTVPGTTSAEVPSEPYRYQNVTCKLCWSLIGRRESSLLRQWTCDMRPIDPLDLNQHSQRMQLLFQQKHLFASITK